MWDGYGSPKATIETDEDRTYFLIDIPCHPAFMQEDVQDVQDMSKICPSHVQDENVDIQSVIFRLSIILPRYFQDISKSFPSQTMRSWLCASYVAQLPFLQKKCLIILKILLLNN